MSPLQLARGANATSLKTLLGVGFALGVGLGMAACSQPSTHPPHTLDANRAAVLLRFAPETKRTVQQLVTPFDRTAIATMDIVPMIATGADTYAPLSAQTGLPTTLDDPQVLKATQTQATLDFDQVVRFSNLRPQTRYRFEVQAYHADGRLISDPASSSVTLETTHEDRPVLGHLKLALIPVPFSGQTRIDVEVVRGAQPYEWLLLEFGKVTGTPQAFTPVATYSTTADVGVLKLDNLAPDTLYRARATAYGSPDDSLPLQTATCDIPVAYDDAPAPATLRLVLP